MKAVIIGGGTGGHVFPAKAIAERLIKDSHEIYWIGKKESLEERVAKDLKINFYALNTYGFRGKNIFLKFLSIWTMLLSFYSSLVLLKKLGPDFVFSFGGYTSLPIGLASKVLNISLFIHEQNSVMGSANKILNLFSNLTFLGFPLADHKEKYVLSGNPLRKEMIKTTRTGETKESLVVLGGSQGSLQLNDLVIKSLKNLKGLKDWHIYHQCGKLDFEEVDSFYLRSGLNYTVKDFFPNIEDYYNKASIIISRSGALTVSEILHFEKPSIFLPLPWAIDNHQFHNAIHLSSIGLSEVIEAKDENSDILTQKLQELIFSKEKRDKMSDKAKLYEKRDSVSIIISSLYESLNK